MKRHLTFGALVGALVLAVVPTTSASAAPVLTPELGGWVAAGDSADFGFEISEATVGDLIVSIELADGTMSVDDSGLALVLQPGFTSFTDVTEISFTGSAADVAAALADRLSWTAPPTPEESYLRLSLSVGTYIDGLIFDSSSGHYYLLSADPLGWADARDAAAAQSYNGLTGYLATISSDAENSFLTTQTGGVTAFFAATSEILYVNPLLPPADQYSDESELRGVFHWGAGPEAGARPSYVPWFPGEPNGVQSDRCLLTNWNGPTALWNDSPCAVPYRYLVEFGGIGTETGPTLFDNLAAAPPARPEAEPVTPTLPDPELAAPGLPDPELAATGVDPLFASTAASIAVVLGLGMLAGSARAASRRRAQLTLSSGTR